MQPFRVFTLQEANRALSRLAEVTQRAQGTLEEIRGRESLASPEEMERLTRSTVGAWVEAVQALGAQPKGLFTVDLRSPDPNVLWCWAPGEGRIAHRHFAWESFKDRIAVDHGSWPARN